MDFRSIFQAFRKFNRKRKSFIPSWKQCRLYYFWLFREFSNTNNAIRITHTFTRFNLFYLSRGIFVPSLSPEGNSRPWYKWALNWYFLNVGLATEPRAPSSLSVPSSSLKIQKVKRKFQENSIEIGIYLYCKKPAAVALSAVPNSSATIGDQVGILLFVISVALILM